MRIDSFEIHNFKGLRQVSAEGLGDQGLIILSGRNGTGKTLILEALLLNWTGRTSLVDFVGPWGNEVRVGMTVTFSSEEIRFLSDWARSAGDSEFTVKESYSLSHSGNKITGKWSIDEQDTAVRVAREPGFQRQYPFSVVDYLPATRNINVSDGTSVDLAMFDLERIEQERSSQSSTITYRSGLHLPDVATYLLTLHYQQFLARQQGVELEDEYSRIAEVFHRASGKTIHQPQYDSIRGGRIWVEAAAGARHELKHLSSGELEMIGLAYFIRRLSASGGVLLLDEPEQHLHPTLQAGLFDSMRNIATRAQVFVVSHSVKLISLAPPNGLLQVGPALEPPANQAVRVGSSKDHADLVASLGILPTDLLQSDMLIIVEGETDSTWLKGLFPIELGRAHVVIAGSSSQVIQACRTLSAIPQLTPWLAVLDRDLRTDEEVAALEAELATIHIWPRRSIESLFIDPRLIAGTIARRTLGRAPDEAALNDRIRRLADPLRNDVLEELVRKALNDRYRPVELVGGGSRFERLRQELDNYSAVLAERAAAVDAVKASVSAELNDRWSSSWEKLVDAKVVLSSLAGEFGFGRSEADIIEALAAQARDDSTLLPETLVEFRDRVISALAN